MDEPWRLRMEVDEIDEKLIDLAVQHYPVFITESQCTQFVSNKVIAL